MNITVLIKTFLRPDVCRRLISSIEKYYPDIRVKVAVDDKNADIFEADTLTLPFDSGLSAGRNALVDVCMTKYCLILDDDCVFTDKTDLGLAIKILEERDLDILEINAGGDYRGIFKTEDGVVTYLPEDRDGLYDFVTNVFVARVDKLKKYGWDESLKMGEHFAYFYKHKGKLRIGYTKEVEVKHDHVANPEYQKYRGRALDYVKKYMKKNNIKKRIDLGGTTLVTKE